MSLPARKVVEILSEDGLIATIKQVEKGKFYSLKQVPETAKIALLIAAAPDLLAQLQKTLLDIEDYSSDEGEFEFTYAGGRKICREIEKAISKAKAL